MVSASAGSTDQECRPAPKCGIITDDLAQRQVIGSVGVAVAVPALSERLHEALELDRCAQAGQRAQHDHDDADRQRESGLVDRDRVVRRDVAQEESQLGDHEPQADGGDTGADPGQERALGSELDRRIIQVAHGIHRGCTRVWARLRLRSVRTTRSPCSAGGTLSLKACELSDRIPLLNDVIVQLAAPPAVFPADCRALTGSQNPPWVVSFHRTKRIRTSTKRTICCLSAWEGA